MLDNSEIASRQRDLKSLMMRGRISGPMVIEHKERIEKIMSPLPPPWEWERMRQQVGMSAADMAGVSGLHQHRIRYYEEGNGTSHPENWVSYAAALQSEVSKRRRQNDQSSLPVPQSRIIESDSVRALVEQLRVTGNSLRIWIDQGVDCAPDDLGELWAAVRLSMRTVRRSEIDLRKRMQESHAENIGRSN